MAFSVPTLDQMTSLLVRDASNRMPGADFAQTSDNWKRLRTLALGITSLHRHLKVIDTDIMPDTAAGPRLDRWGTIYAVPRKLATGASADAAGRVTGTVATAITTGDEATDPAGLRYQVDETTVVAGVGYTDVRIAAIDTGAATRLRAGTILTFSSTPAGLNSSIVLVADLDTGGVDDEEDGPYRERILDKIRQPEMGGNAQDFRAWAKEVSGVDEAFVWPLRAGLGSVHIAGLKLQVGDNPDRALTEDEIEDVQTNIDLKRPIAYEDALVIATTPDPQEIEIALETQDDPEFVRDWDDSPGFTVDTWTAGTRLLKLSADRPADMEVGDRLIYKRTSGTLNNGAEYTIEGFGASDEVILALVPVQGDTELATLPPVAGNPVYSGGPTVAPTREAVLDYVNNLGPARADSELANTDYSEGGAYWDGTLRVSRLHGESNLIDGVIDATIVAPTVNYTPANVAPEPEVGYVTPKRVLVRHA